MGLKPTFAIYAGNKNITHLINERLIDLTLSDEDGFKSDELNITLQDDGISFPRQGMLLKCYLGYDDINEDMGTYIVDSVTISGSPDIIKISAKGTPFDAGSEFGTLQTSKTKSYIAGTLETLVQNIATSHKLTYAISKTLREVTLPHITQISESDMNLLTRITQKYDALFKIANGKILIFKKGEMQSVGGKNLPIIFVNKKDCLNWSCQTDNTEKYQTVKAVYRDVKKGRDEIVSVGEGNPVKKLKEVFKDAETARSAAKSALNRYNRKSLSVDVSMVGNSRLKAGFPLFLSDFRVPMNGDWIAKQVSHSLNSSGYTTSFTAEKKHD